MQTAGAALVRSQNDTRLRHAMDHLFHRLRKFVRAVPRAMDEPLPDHDVVWMTEFDGGPGKALLDAIKMHPELWMPALPDDVCIVPKKDLELFAAQWPGATEVMIANGAYLVDRQAGKLRFEFEEAEQRKRYGR